MKLPVNILRIVLLLTVKAFSQSNCVFDDVYQNIDSLSKKIPNTLLNSNKLSYNNKNNSNYVEMTNFICNSYGARLNLNISNYKKYTDSEIKNVINKYSFLFLKNAEYKKVESSIKNSSISQTRIKGKFLIVIPDDFYSSFNVIIKENKNNGTLNISINFVYY